MNDSEGWILLQVQKKTIFPRTMKMKWVVIQTVAKAAWKEVFHSSASLPYKEEALKLGHVNKGCISLDS